MPVDVERRAHPRFELLAQVQVARESEVHIMSADRISRGGVFVKGEPERYPELQVGTRVELVVFDAERPGQEDLALEAQVVRVESGEASAFQPGFGLKFSQLSGFEVGALDSFLERLKGPHRS
jgi:c-di-GMP-binding flagellar brake protein YcgR